MIPLFVTRKTADGKSGAYSVAAWPFLITCALVHLNVLAWSLIGLYTAAKVVF